MTTSPYCWSTFSTSLLSARLRGRGEILMWTEQSAQFLADRATVEAALAEAMMHGDVGRNTVFRITAPGFDLTLFGHVSE